MLGRIPFSDPQALRDPRPLGAISGRDLPAAYRWDFSTGTAQTNPTRIDGWWSSSPSDPLSWNQSRQALSVVGPEDGESGQNYIIRGWNGAGAEQDYLNIDTSIYKYVVTQFTVNKYPNRIDEYTLEPLDPFGGRFHWSDNTTGSFPFSIQKSQVCRRVPYFNLTQPSDGFDQADRDMASTFKLVFDMTDNSEWTGTASSVRLDYWLSDANYIGDPPDIDVDYIEIVAFHNTDI
tara:strand:+ start:375 stop:1076 length:702 start_codon:yes stop_codon:yes gene_type:complete